jgi:centrosomal CEP192-like protein/ASPM-SPD-2-Hydin domain-containing protein/HYDIN/CFA65/VesB family protein
MRRARKISSQNLMGVAGAIVLLASLTVLVGCQGVSAGGNSTTQQQTGSLSLSTSTLDFGSVTAGSSKALTVTAANTQTQSVTITSIAISTKYFTLTAPSLPVVIAAGQSVSLGVNFTPNAAGAFTATLSVSSDASNTVPNLSLSGTGVSDGQMTLSPSSQAFGSVTVGTKQSQSVTLTNTGATSVSISQASISGTGFQLSGITAPLTLNASQSVTFIVAFAPQTTGSATGTVTITSDASNSTLTMGLSGTGVSPGALGPNPTSLAFGSVTVGSNQTLSESVSNTGGSTVTISQVGVSGTGFSLSGITTPLTLAAGQSANFSVTFAPQSAAAVNGSVTVTSTASNPTLTIALSGTGTSTVGQLTVAPTTLALGSVVVGTSGTASGSLTANGANVTVTAASTSNSVFSVGGLSLPVTISTGKSVPFTVTFSPTTNGVASASLTFTSNAQPSTTIEALTGTGTPAPTHTVNLSWNASTSSNISGYNIYRAVYGTSCGNYGKINGVLNTTTIYTDSSVSDGVSYCYAATAVNSSDEESSYSNIVTNIQIPSS